MVFINSDIIQEQIDEAATRRIISFGIYEDSEVDSNFEELLEETEASK